MKSSDVGYAAVHFSGCAPYFLLDLLQQSQLETTDLDIHVLPEAFLEKIAVGGHSYGAFMTANLLIHAPHLFCCGISRSGAYNRTLTPFGFQVLFTIFEGH
jgi:dipeptidyl aminopeptidase/acylaminoacyl peptidase